MSDDTVAAPETGGAQQEQGTAAPDFGPLMEQFDSRFGDITARLDALAPAEEPAEDVDPWVQEYGHLFEEPEQEQDLQQQAAGDAQALQALQALAQRTQGQDHAVQQVMQRLEQMELREQATQLMERYPELREQQHATQALEAAAQAAASLGRPELANSPGLVELVYRASRADALAQSGVPAGDEHVRLEGGGGAAPTPQDENVGQGIVAAMGGGSIWGRRSA